MRCISANFIGTCTRLLVGGSSNLWLSNIPLICSPKCPLKPNQMSWINIRTVNDWKNRTWTIIVRNTYPFKISVWTLNSIHQHLTQWWKLWLNFMPFQNSIYILYPCFILYADVYQDDKTAEGKKETNLHFHFVFFSSLIPFALPLFTRLRVTVRRVYTQLPGK